MSSGSPFLVLNSDCEHATQWLEAQMAGANLTLLRTFNSNDVGLAGLDCMCPHHGGPACNCRVMIYLVYRKSLPTPASLMVYSYDQYTLFYLVDTPHQRTDPGLDAQIRRVLIPQPALLFGDAARSESQPKQTA